METRAEPSQSCVAVSRIPVHAHCTNAMILCCRADITSVTTYGAGQYGRAGANQARCACSLQRRGLVYIILDQLKDKRGVQSPEGRSSAWRCGTAGTAGLVVQLRVTHACMHGKEEQQ